MFKRIGQFTVDSGSVMLVDPSYLDVDPNSIEGRFAQVRVTSDGIYPVLEFEHEGTRYIAFPATPGVESKGTWVGWAQFSADRQQDANDQV